MTEEEAKLRNIEMHKNAIRAEWEFLIGTSRLLDVACKVIGTVDRSTEYDETAERALDLAEALIRGAVKRRDSLDWAKDLMKRATNGDSFALSGKNP